MQNPDIILADEPISSLDVSNANTVMQALQRINRERGITVIVNLHTLGVARRYCPRIIGMISGKIVFDGPPMALNDAALSEIYRGPMDDPDMPEHYEAAA
jgi:phosphonate transport system ATP-binding protein